MKVAEVKMWMFLILRSGGEGTLYCQGNCTVINIMSCHFLQYRKYPLTSSFHSNHYSAAIQPVVKHTHLSTYYIEEVNSLQATNSPLTFSSFLLIPAAHPHLNKAVRHLIYTLYYVYSTCT